MRLRSVIIDDEETGIETLKLLIEKHVGEDIKVVSQATQAQQAIEMIENYMPDIVFLDISMPEMDGFELLEKLQWKNFKLVFTTAHQEYGLKALKLNATDYLLKPVDPKDLCFAVAKIKSQVAEQKEMPGSVGPVPLDSIHPFLSSKLGISSKDGIEYIDPAEIILLESRSNYTLVYLNGAKTILTPKTLRDFEAQLCNNINFMRVHHSFIINLQKVLRYTKEKENIVMLNNQSIALAKSRRDVFFEWLKL